jgi:hypothetical protein
VEYWKNYADIPLNPTDMRKDSEVVTTLKEIEVDNISIPEILFCAFCAFLWPYQK